MSTRAGASTAKAGAAAAKSATVSQGARATAKATVKVLGTGKVCSDRCIAAWLRGVDPALDHLLGTPAG